MLEKKLTQEKKLLDLYTQGENISLYLKDNQKEYNSSQIIELSYDLQAGTYIKALENKDLYKHKIDYSKQISKVINDLCKSTPPCEIMEIGVGEATTLKGVIENMSKDISFYGFDISFSRLLYAKKFLSKNKLFNVDLCIAEFLNLPYLDNSIDIVYTSHSIEPNRGKEEEILKELYRVANKYIILLEPAYELTNDENRARMDKYGYCKGLKQKALELGYEVIKHELFPYSANPSNPTAITIIKKNTKEKKPDLVYADPKYKSALKKFDEVYFSEDRLCIYPIINNIPCLRVQNAITASKYEIFNT